MMKKKIPPGYSLNRNGYLKDANNELIHRKIARNMYQRDYQLYKEKYPDKNFTDLVVHHIDGNKTNNSETNLEILSREDHSQLHGFSTHRGIPWILISIISFVLATTFGAKYNPNPVDMHPVVMVLAIIGIITFFFGVNERK